jgi:CheY-like chemotaxis protein
VQHVYLIAEDEEASRILLKRAFLKSGLNVPVHFIIDGQETIDYLRGKGKFKDRAEFPFPAILLLDYQMPKLNGFNVLKEIRTDATLKKLAVVMLSSSISELQIQRAYELGVNSYIEKPSDFGELVHSIACIHQYWFGCNHFPHAVGGIVHPEKRHRSIAIR